MVQMVRLERGIPLFLILLEALHIDLFVNDGEILIFVDLDLGVDPAEVEGLRWSAPFLLFWVGTNISGGAGASITLVGHGGRLIFCIAPNHFGRIF